MLATYNVRGLNKKPKQVYARQFLSTNAVSFAGLIETRVKEHNAPRIANALCQNWEWAFNYDHHGNGRIRVGWNPFIWKVDILFLSSQVVHCNLQLLNSNIYPFLISVIYGLNSASGRRLLWSDLTSLNSPNCWCLMGDFNEIKDPIESDSTESFWNTGMEDFKECSDLLGIEDIRGIGPLFTWWNSQTVRPIHRRLDRAMGNGEWLSNFPGAQVLYGPMGLSDHSPVLLNINCQAKTFKKPFQFFNFMLLLDGLGTVYPMHGFIMWLGIL